jgi:hypothetical protein
MQPESQPPAKPRRLHVRLDDAGDRLALTYRRREWGGGCFMLLWLIGWTVGCVFLAGMVSKDPTLFHIAFAVPFWAAWIFVFSMVVRSLCCVERFEVIGLLMLAGLVLAVLDPFRRTIWRFTRRSIEHRITWFGLGPTWQYEAEALERIEIHRADQRAKSAGPRASKSAPEWPRKESGEFSLAFIDRDNVEVCSIDKLTEGEAGWIRDLVLGERPHWFR